MSKVTKPDVWEVTLPKTKCRWAKVLSPEDKIGDKHLPKKEQSYSVELLFDKDEIEKHYNKVDKMISEMEKFAISEIKEKGLPTGKEKRKLADMKVQDNPFKTEYDDETGEELDIYCLRPRKKAFFINLDKGTEKKLTVPIVDSKGNPFPKDKEIGNDSIVKARVKFNPYTFGEKVGVSAKLIALMVVDLVEYGAGSFKFDENDFEEDGYEVDETNEADSEASPLTDPDGDEDF